MLTLIIEKQEFFDEETQEFYEVPETVLQLEHSLVSLSKWESKFKKPFLNDSEKTNEELLAYVGHMIVSDFFDYRVLLSLNNSHMEAINEYINSPESATTFGEMPKTQKRRGEVITSELIYYWLVAFNIPFECETWHLNRLFALIRICNIKNSPPKKMSRHEIASRNRELNAARRAKYGTTG